MADVSLQNAAEAPVNGLQDLTLNEPAPAAPTAQNGGPRGGRGGKSGRGGSSGGSRGGGRDQDSPETQLSKALSYILRHGAAKEGVKIRPDGYIELDKVLARPKISKIIFPSRQGGVESTSAIKRSPDLQDVLDCVESNAKKRFELSTDEEGKHLIRAVQGHSIKEVVDLSHEPLTLENLSEKLPRLSPPIQAAESGEERAKLYPEHVLLHGTDPIAWEAIRASGGLLTMNRNHIHLATGKPGDSGLISGMRNSSKVLIFIDVRKALQEGVHFGVASNGAVLTAGLPYQKPQGSVEQAAQEKETAQLKQSKGSRKGTGKYAVAASSGILPLEYVARVEDDKGNILWTP